MKATIAAILCVGLVCGGVARADLEKGTYAPDVEAKEWLNTDEPVTLTELRGMTVMLFFWVSWHEGGEYVMPLMNLINSRIGRSQGVYLLGLTDSDRARVGEMLKEQKVMFPVGLESESYDDYKISSFPRVVIIDPNGKVAWTGWPGRGGDELYRAALDVLGETPPTKTHPEDAVLVEEHLHQARVALRDNDYVTTFREARDAANLALTGDPLKTRCQDMLDLVEALGRDQLASAIQAADEKRFEDAIDVLGDLRREFKGMAVYYSARRKLEALEKKYDEVKRLLQLHGERTGAENLLAKAMDDLRANPRRIGEAYAKLEEIVSEYGDTEGAGKAQTILDRMHQNEGVMGYVRDHKAAPECDMLLSQARAFEHTGRPNSAKEIYRRIIREFPDTVYVDRAAERLAQLP